MEKAGQHFVRIAPSYLHLALNSLSSIATQEARSFQQVTIITAGRPVSAE
jgi:hypothetical protein